MVYICLVAGNITPRVPQQRDLKTRNELAFLHFWFPHLEVDGFFESVVNTSFREFHIWFYKVK